MDEYNSAVSLSPFTFLSIQRQLGCLFTSAIVTGAIMDMVIYIVVLVCVKDDFNR